MNYLSFIVPPIVGAAIGYSTNWIAVKMLFRPLKPVKIGKFTMPFTPGLIPKSKPRLAKALGEAVSSNLLSNEDLLKSMLSNETINNLNTRIEEYLKADTSTAKNIISSYASEESYMKFVNFSSDKISDLVLEKIKDKNLGKLISEEIQTVASEKMKGSLLRFIWRKFYSFFTW